MFGRIDTAGREVGGPHHDHESGPGRAQTPGGGVGGGARRGVGGSGEGLKGLRPRGPGNERVDVNMTTTPRASSRISLWEHLTRPLTSAE